MFNTVCRNRTGFSLVIILSVLFFLPSCRYFRERGIFNGRAIKIALIRAKEDSLRKTDSVSFLKYEAALPGNAIYDTTGIKHANFNETAQEYELKPVAENLSVENSDKKDNKFFIIAATCSQMEKAKERQKEFDTQGYKTDILEAVNRYGSKLLLVSVMSYDDFSKADYFLRGFRQNAAPGAWLYTLK
jgi:hypothetical protein